MRSARGFLYWRRWQLCSALPAPRSSQVVDWESARWLRMRHLVEQNCFGRDMKGAMKRWRLDQRALLPFPILDENRLSHTRRESVPARIAVRLNRMAASVMGTLLEWR
jgi:hypothetical protein